MKKRKNKKTENKELTWDLVEKYLKEETPGGAAMSLIETEKILELILDRLQFEGKTLDEKLISAKNELNNYQDLKTARTVTKKIQKELYATITPPETREIIKPYLEAIRVLTKSKRNNASFFAKLSFNIKNKLPVLKSFFIYSLVSLFVFFLGVFLVDSTEIGKQFGEAIISISSVLFSWVLFTILLVTGITIIGVTTIFYFEKQRKKSSLQLPTVEPSEEDDQEKDRDTKEK